jgi:dynactin complex subunit
MRREQALAELQQQLVRMNATLLQTLQQHAETQRVLAAEVARLREASATAQSSRQADAQERLRQLEQQNQATESRAHELESEIKKLRGGLFHLRSRNGKVVELDSSSPWR